MALLTISQHSYRHAKQRQVTSLNVEKVCLRSVIILKKNDNFNLFMYVHF